MLVSAANTSTPTLQPLSRANFIPRSYLLHVDWTYSCSHMLGLSALPRLHACSSPTLDQHAATFRQQQ
jgi:hypothetical protein